MLTMTSLGAAGTVTGSKHLLEHDGKRILIDCGLFQGMKNLRELNWEPLPVAPASIDAVILTHAHLDHSGYLPRLVRDGFRGRIYATAATRDVAALILKDSGYLNEKDADFLNRIGATRHKPALPLYGVKDAERALEYFTPVSFSEPVKLPGGATVVPPRRTHSRSRDCRRRMGRQAHCLLGRPRTLFRSFHARPGASSGSRLPGNRVDLR